MTASEFLTTVQTKKKKKKKRSLLERSALVGLVYPASYEQEVGD